MLRLIACALLVPTFSLSATRSTFEVRGEILPHEAASVEIHAVSSPFAASTLAGPDGHFRFKDIQPGAYTVLIATHLGREVRRTVEVSGALANSRHQVALQIRADGEDVSRDSSTTLSAQEWQVPQRALREYKEAQKEIAKRDFDAARASLSRAVEIEPRFVAAWNQLGTMAYQSARYREAEADFRRGIEADPNAYEPLVNLGGVLLNLGQFEEALRYNNEAATRRPHDALAQSQLGMAHAFLNQLDPAEKHLSEAARLDPEHFSHPQLLLADVYVRKNEPLRAAEQLQGFLQGHPDWPAAARMKQQIADWRSVSEQGSGHSVREQR
jgi:tetratricopeptide (TPR) repeat protein